MFSERVFLRPETAQGAYINFHLAMKSMRRSIPFGVGQYGKSFRNEISPGRFLFRTREFEQLELQYFCHPSDADCWFQHWVDTSLEWLTEIGMNIDHVRKRQHSPEELAHYAIATVDLEYRYPFGWGELWGISNRGDNDLRRHMIHSQSDYAGQMIQSTNERFVPHVIEPALGLGRLMYALLLDAYKSEVVNDRERTVLQLHKDISPYQIAILPISKKPELTCISEQIFEDMSNKYRVDIDFTGSIGKRYRRHDEIGTPACLTVDFETARDNCVTIRDRDTMRQVRIGIPEVVRGEFDL